MSNFDFLKNEFKDLYLNCKEAEDNVFVKPRTSCFYNRRALEIAVNILFDVEGLQRPYKEIKGRVVIERGLAPLINSYEFKKVLDNNENLEKLNLIRVSGNEAVHKNSLVSSDLSLTTLEILFDFTNWLAYCYGTLEEEKQFNETIIPKSLNEKEDELLKKIEQLKLENTKILENLNYSKVEVKKEKEFIIKNISEAKTRKLYIDILLKEAGWNINEPNVKEYKVSGMPNKSEGGYADYVLWGANGKPLAVVEAKKTLKSSEEGKHQVTLYAECLERQWGQYPIRFYTNGFETYIWEKDEVPRRIYGFYRKEELETLIIRREQAKTIEQAKSLIDPNIAGRPYQERAITKVIENYYNKYRKSLLVMATGSGKTRTAISIVDVLLKANRIKRVLFLADRKALVRQAKNNFTKLIGSNNTMENLVELNETSRARIVFSTYQTMINEIDKLREDSTRQFGVGYFDLIIIDESHRSIYKKYGIIFDYFDSLLLGLTATPKSEIDFNTYKVFDLPNNIPTDSYNLYDAAKDGFLVLPKVKEVDLKFPEEGIKYSNLPDDEKEEYELKFSDAEGNIPESIDGKAVNEWLFNKNTVEKVIETFYREGHKIEGGDKIAKSIIFAKNDRHADFIVKVFNEMFPYLGGEFCQKITNTVSYSQDLIDRFLNIKKMPQIAVSVDMLDTGIDIPELLNLIFFKKIRSKTKFWQMIGRGTRLCSNIFGPKLNKEDFYIFDFCKNFTYFEANEKEIESRIQESLTQKIFNIRVEIANILQDSNYKEEKEYMGLWESIIEILHKDIININKESAFARKEIRYIEKYKDLEELKVLNDKKIVEIKNHISVVIISNNLDEISKRFDLKILVLQLSILKIGKGKCSIIRELNVIGKSLEKIYNIPKVMDKKKSIQLLNNDRFWDGISVVDLEFIRLELRDLVKYLIGDESSIEFIYSNFKDEIVGMETKDISFGRLNYLPPKERVKKLLDENQDKTSVKKLKWNISLNSRDIEELNIILFSNGVVSLKEIQETCLEELESVGFLLRSLTGLEKEAIQIEFSKLIEANGFTGIQVEFMEYIIEYYVKEGFFNPKKLDDKSVENLYGASFFEMFSEDKEIISILATIEKINNTAKFDLN